MSGAGHPTRCRPESREPAEQCCLRGASSLERATRTVDNSIASLGRSAPGNTIGGVLLLSRPFIPVRKNYLTRRADAWGLTSQRGRSLLVGHGIPGQRAGSSRRLRDRRTGRHLPTDHRTATRAERLFFVVSFQGGTLCCGRGGVAPQAVVGHDALPPPPVLGYSNPLFLAPSVPRLEKLAAIS